MTARWQRDLRRLERSVVGARFWGGVADALFVLGLGAAVLVLALRLADLAVPGSLVTGLFGLVLAGAVAQGVRAARRPLPPGLPAWLDRAAGHRGLLLAALDVGDGAAWRKRLERTAPLPRLRVRRLLARALPPLALLALVALLPDRPRPDGGRLVATALRDVAAELAEAEAAGELDAATAERLRERIEELQERDGRPAWTELDAFADRLAVEREAAAPRRSAAREALRAAAAGQAPLDDALRRAADAGLLRSVPRGTLRRLGVDPATGRLEGPEGSGGAGGAASGLDPDRAARIARAVEEAARRGDAGRPGTGPGGTRRPREGDGSSGKGRRGDAGRRPGGAAGEGGVTRGRGDAPLRFLNETKGDPDRFSATRLPDHPPGAGRSRRIEGSEEAADPEPAPDPSEGGAGAAATGHATERRVIRPRHRDVVRRYHEAR